ncbi:MAG: hypothetical protein KY475_08730 [Planctomycetes bacterium]|nr:hypothetical protein [Planctomycetota bacterium]
MRRHLCVAMAIVLTSLAAVGAAWDAPRTPNRLVEFFEEGQEFFLDTFAGGYQAVKLDDATEQALRKTRGEEEFRSNVYRVIRRGEDFVHFRSASEETDVILSAAALKRVSYRVERRFD